MTYFRHAFYYNLSLGYFHERDLRSQNRVKMQADRLAGRSERRAHPGPPADHFNRDATREVAFEAKKRSEGDKQA